MARASVISVWWVLLIRCEGRIGDKENVSRPAFISEVQQYCYDKLVHDDDCCLDQQLHPGVTQKVIPPGAFGASKWHCGGGHLCWDDKKGERGEAIVWTPSGANCTTPRLLFLHGGSWEFCAPATCGYDVLASKIAALSGVVVLVVDYPLLPQGNFSSIIAHGEQALRWLALHGPEGESCSQDTEPILFLGGDSSGGGSAASLALRVAATLRLAQQGHTKSKSGHVALAQDEEEVLPRVSGTFLFSPWLNLMCNTSTYYLNAFSETHTKAGPVYTGDIMFQGAPDVNSHSYLENAKQYVQDDSLLVDPVASPFFAKADHFDPSMHVYIVASATEAVAGESVRFAHMAAKGGATAYLNLYPGMWHDFPMYAEGCGSGQDLHQAKNALNGTAEFLRARSIEAAAQRDSGVSVDTVPAGPAAPLTAVIFGNSQGGLDMHRVVLQDPLDVQDVPAASPPSVQSWHDRIRIRDMLFLLVGVLLGAFLRWQWATRCCSDDKQLKASGEEESSAMVAAPAA